MMVGVVVSRQIVDVQGTTAYSGRNADVRRRGGMTDGRRMIRGIGEGWGPEGGGGAATASARDGYANRRMMRRNVSSSERRARRTKSRMQEPVWNRRNGEYDRIGEATTKRNTMNVPMCKLQAERTPRSMVSPPSPRELSGCVWILVHWLRDRDPSFAPPSLPSLPPSPPVQREVTDVKSIIPKIREIRSASSRRTRLSIGDYQACFAASRFVSEIICI